MVLSLDPFEFWKVINSNSYDDRPDSLKDYEFDYVDPLTLNTWEFDQMFAWYRLAGPNPIQIKPCPEDFLEDNFAIDSIDESVKSKVESALAEQSALHAGLLQGG